MGDSSVDISDALELGDGNTGDLPQLKGAVAANRVLNALATDHQG